MQHCTRDILSCNHELIRALPECHFRWTRTPTWKIDTQKPETDTLGYLTIKRNELIAEVKDEDILEAFARDII